MNRKIIDSFKHKIGSHCASSLMRDILEYFGYPLTEEMCFGIGAGLGFVYRKSFNPPLYMVLGRNSDLEEKISEHFGFFASTNTTCDNDKAWSDVRFMIDHDIPVLLDVDASGIPYLKERFNLFDYVRYGGHRVCLVGYDYDRNTVIVADYIWQELKEIDMGLFRESRSSDIYEFPSRNLWYRFYFPEKIISIEEAVIRGIGLTVHSMKYPPNRQSGLYGAEKFIRQVRLWPYETNDMNHVMKNAYIAYMMLEAVGTGGGNFRRIYARFLRQVSKIFMDDAFFRLSEKYFDIASEWSAVSKLLLESSKNAGNGIFDKSDDRMQVRLDDLYKSETECIDELESLIQRKYSDYGYNFLRAKGDCVG
jgi:hypothetical protein